MKYINQIKTTFISLLFLLLITPAFKINGVNYTGSAESISWNGAYTSVADGFEAMLYNPAGVYMTDRKFGLNLFGSYGLRAYNNVFSTDDLIDVGKIITVGNQDITDIITRKLNIMPPLGMDMGLDMTAAPIMTYIKLESFALSIAMIPKTSFTVTVGKEIFTTVLQDLDLTKELDFEVKSTLLQYIDLNFGLSTRARFIEKYVAVEAIYTGINLHVYLPTAYMNFSGKTTIKAGDPDPTTGIYTYDASFKGTIAASGNYIMSALLKNAGIKQDALNNLFNNMGTAAWGLGLDLGFIIKFNRFVRYGLSITDVGFLVFPESASGTLRYNMNLNPTRMVDFAYTFRDSLSTEIADSIDRSTTAQFFMPQTAIRTGVGVTPIRNKSLGLIIAADISLSDLNRIINGGYATFNFAAGFELSPKINWFEVPFRMAINYNSQANVASLSLGTGLHLGPVEMELGLKGLEALISDWGAKEFAVGVDFKLEF